MRCPSSVVVNVLASYLYDPESSFPLSVPLPLIHSI